MRFIFDSKALKTHKQSSNVNVTLGQEISCVSAMVLNKVILHEGMNISNIIHDNTTFYFSVIDKISGIKESEEIIDIPNGFYTMRNISDHLTKILYEDYGTSFWFNLDPVTGKANINSFQRHEKYN